MDGAAAVLLGDKEFGERWGLTPRARIKATAKIGTDPTIMLTGPVPVTQKILRDTGMEISDIDLFEVNEAFASVVMRFEQAFNVDHDRVNVNGGSIAMGHPLGATGAMILGTLLDEMERSDRETGLAALCIGSGMGAATIIERVRISNYDRFYNDNRCRRHRGYYMGLCGQIHERVELGCTAHLGWVH